MATILTSTLVADTRLMSDLKDNQVCTDDEIAGYLSDAGSELYDIFTDENQYYDISTFDFTLSGGVGDANGINSWDLSGTPGDFQQGHSLELNPDTPNPITVDYLSNWLNRNDNVGGVIFAGNVLSRQYTFSGSLLKVFPPVNAAGKYRLYYTPTWTALMLPQPPPGPTPVLTAFEFGAGGGLVDFTGTTFTEANVGDTMISTGDANSANNFTATIIAVSSATVVQVDTPLATEGSPSASITLQPQGTRSDLPAQMNPWALYLKVHASITIRTKRDQNVDALEAKLAALKQRIATTLTNRKEEPSQPPLTRDAGGWYGGGWPF
jgi:hypothetical protein